MSAQSQMKNARLQHTWAIAWFVCTLFGCSSDSHNKNSVETPGDSSAPVTAGPIEADTTPPEFGALTPISAEPATTDTDTSAPATAELVEADNTSPALGALTPGNAQSTTNTDTSVPATATPDAPTVDQPTSDNCPAYSESTNFRSRSKTLIIDSESDWISAIEQAGTDTEILMEDGDYLLNRYAAVVGSGVTIRSLNGDRERVRIIGEGYSKGSEGFMIIGNDVTIADLSISDFRDHAVAVKPDAGAMQGLQLYNLDIKDIGTQHIKVSPGGSRDGLVACSNIGYSTGAAVGDYNGAIDIHGTIDWLIRDNFIYNITGDGSGCNVDKDCGQYLSAPAIYAWSGASGTTVIRNTIVDSFRNIAFGMGTSHFGGSIAHNQIIQSIPGDAGVELFGASDLVVEFNTVQLSGDYPGTIEYRDSRNITITNNTLSSEPWDRGGNVNVELRDNIENP